MIGSRPLPVELFMASRLYSEIELGGVRVGVSGPTTTLPTYPERDRQADEVWPTAMLTMRAKVKMADGSRWRVRPAPRRTVEGDVIVTLTSPAPERRQLVIRVPRNLLEHPLWWTGDPLPSAEVPQIPGTGEHSDEPLGKPPVTPPDTPVKPSPGNSGGTPGGGHSAGSRANSVR